MGALSDDVRLFVHLSVCLSPGILESLCLVRSCLCYSVAFVICAECIVGCG